jgi:geranylgeranyl transferase type-2 subunit beta
LTDGYLAVLDALLADGLRARGAAFGMLQSEYARHLQLPDGGFPGRQGGSDLYYTDFALRVLSLTDLPASTASRAADYLTQVSTEPRDAVECFSWLNSRRLLALVGRDVPMQREALVIVIAEQRLLDGGYSVPYGTRANAYQTFVAELCLQMLGEELRYAEDAVTEIARLQAADGGFGNEPGEGAAQTSATAAALGFLTLQDALGDEQARAACSFLAAMQVSDGGLRAHPQAPVSDLLSTFTGLLSLVMLDGYQRLDLKALGRFVRGCARAAGGFGAFPGDDGDDLEYAYYGLGCVALLRTVVEAER